MELRPAKSGAMANKRAPDLDAIIKMMEGTSTLEAVQYFRHQFSKVMNQLGMSEQVAALDPKFQDFEDSVAHVTTLRSPKQAANIEGVAIEFTKSRGRLMDAVKPEATPEAGSDNAPTV